MTRDLASDVPDGPYELIALPLKLAGMDATPVRVASKLIPGDAFVFLLGLAIFGGLYVWAQIFATHLCYSRQMRRDAHASGPTRRHADGRDGVVAGQSEVAG